MTYLKFLLRISSSVFTTLVRCFLVFLLAKKLNDPHKILQEQVSAIQQTQSEYFQTVSWPEVTPFLSKGFVICYTKPIELQPKVRIEIPFILIDENLKTEFTVTFIDHINLYNTKFLTRFSGQGSCYDISPTISFPFLSNDNSQTKSPSVMIKLTKFLIFIIVILMMCSETSAAPVTPSYSREQRNKLRVIHAINSVAQPILLKVYQYVKQKHYDDSKTIKDHLIIDNSWTVDQYENEFDGSMKYVIQTTDASGAHYDISLLIKCIRTLSKIHDHKNQWRWGDYRQLENQCQRLSYKRNAIFHSSIGINCNELRREIGVIENLLNDILFSLGKRFTSNKTEITNMKKDMLDNISFILTQPLEQAQINLLSQFAKMNINDEIIQYKKRCTKFGKIKILDFLPTSNSFHDIKLLFTEVIIKKSKKHKSNTNIDCKDILNMMSVSPSTIILLESVAGGGKSTLCISTIDDWGKGSNDMNTRHFYLVIPMIFRDSSTNSVEDLIRKLFPNAMEDVMKSISNPKLKILFICDGYDENNNNSKKIFTEILTLKRNHEHIDVIITSRPEAVQELYYNKGTDLNIEHLQIEGVLENKRGEFLEKYHSEITAAKGLVENADELLNFYSTCSDRHKELYRLPINLVILAWIWVEDKTKAKTIRSPAALYTSILEIMNKKLRYRLVESYPDVMNHVKRDLNKLDCLINIFKETLYTESLVALRNDQIYIDEESVKKLMEICDKIQLPFLELKGAYLLSKIEWLTDLKESLEFPHKAMMEYYSGKSIQSKLIQEDHWGRWDHWGYWGHWINWVYKCLKTFIAFFKGGSIKRILLELHDNNERQFNINKFQNTLKILGGILAMGDPSLLNEHGPEIIKLLAESGIRENAQWIDVFSDFNINPTAAEKFAKLIGLRLEMNRYPIKNSDVEGLATLFKYVDIQNVLFRITGNKMPTHLPALINVLGKKRCQIESINKITEDQVEFWNSAIEPNNEIGIKNVTFDISGQDTPFKLPSLMNVLRSKDCNIEISNVVDEQLSLWTPIITPNDKIKMMNVNLKYEYTSLPFLSGCASITNYKLYYYWRNLNDATHLMTECPSATKNVFTAVETINVLPTSIIDLHLGILANSKGTAVDPGLNQLKQRFLELRQLCVHIAAGTGVQQFPSLPDLLDKQGLPSTKLYLSKLSTDDDLHWAQETSQKLQPQNGYYDLIFPRCNLSVHQLCRLMTSLAAAGVRVIGNVWVSGHHSCEEAQQLEAATRSAFPEIRGGSTWFQDETQLSKGFSNNFEGANW